MKWSLIQFAIVLLLVSGCHSGGGASEATPTETPAPALTSTATNFNPGAVIGDLNAELPHGVTRVPNHKREENGAFAFSVASDMFTAPVNIDPDAMPECTLVTWAKFTGNPSSAGIQQVVSHDNGGYDRSIGLDNRAGQWGWSCFAGTQNVVGGFPVEVGTWTFLAVSYNQPAKEVEFYAGFQHVKVTGAELGSGHETTNIGSNPSYEEKFQGDIEPVLVFDRVLTPQEIESLRTH